MQSLLRWCCIAALAPGTAHAQSTFRVNLSSTGDTVNADLPIMSYRSVISADGTHVTFESEATNMVPNDTNGFMDIFVRNLTTGVTVRVNVSSTGEQSNEESRRPCLSADGRYVAFESNASNLVPGDTFGNWDIFVRDIVAGTTKRVSVKSNGDQCIGHSLTPSISLDGRYVAFQSSGWNIIPADSNQHGDVFVHDMQTSHTTRVSVGGANTQANGDSYLPAISGDGRFVLFASDASNLVPNDTNQLIDLFVRDRQTSVTERVSVDSNGAQANDYTWPIASISADGRRVCFQSWASTLDEDTNSWEDIFVHDRATGETRIVSVDSNGIQGNDISHDPQISPDGRYATYTTRADDIVPNDTNGYWDVILYDLWTRKAERVSVTNSGQEAQTGTSAFPWLSYDGRYVLFTSRASDLVANDFEGFGEDFVRDRATTSLDGFCFGDGSLATACPCAPPNTVPNPSGAVGHGCANSLSPAGAVLSAGGTLSPDTVVFNADIGTGYIGFALLVKGNAQSASGIANGDGLRCVDGALIRVGGHGAGTNGAPVGSWTYPNVVQTLPITQVTAQGPGSAWYQLFYRNATPSFCSAGTTNWSNGVSVTWPP
ncbi:MAG: TolB family protein [Planctomycetota bacterium]